jgi:protein dithiol:quinone oxidoreductase
MSGSILSLWLRRPRPIYGLVAVVALALIAAAVTLQFVERIEPCPLCILQRYAFTLVALFAAVAAATGGRASTACALLAVASAVAGAGVSAWHVHLQLFPPPETSCGPSLQYLLGNLPMGRALPKIFLGYGDCSEVNWTFLRLSLPAWALIWLLALAGALVIALRRRR